MCVKKTQNADQKLSLVDHKNMDPSQNEESLNKTYINSRKVIFAPHDHTDHDNVTAF